MDMPRQYAICKFTVSREDDWEHYPFSKYDKFIFLGDIPNMPGHCIVSHIRTGQIFSCYHTDNFEEIPEDET